MVKEWPPVHGCWNSPYGDYYIRQCVELATRLKWDGYNLDGFGCWSQCFCPACQSSYAADNDGKKIRQFKGDGGTGHAANFIQAVRDRRAERLNAPIRQGHISSAVCHLGNLSYRLGSLATWEDIEQAADAFPRAHQTVVRLKQHVTANGVSLQRDRLLLGPWLTIDPETGRITGLKAAGGTVDVKEAERLAHGSYRAPFVVPENV